VKQVATTAIVATQASHSPTSGQPQGPARPGDQGGRDGRAVVMA